MARDERQAMTSERLAEIRAQYALLGQIGRRMSNGSYRPSGVERELLAEVERLRAQMESDKDATWKLVHAYNERGEQLKALLTVVEKVWTLAVQSTYDGKWFIPHVHAAHILIEQTRALLASAEAEAGNADEQAAQIEREMILDSDAPEWAPLTRGKWAEAGDGEQTQGEA